MRSAWHNLTNAFMFNPIPVSARPVFEWATNTSMFTGIPIEPYWERKALPAAERVGPSTTAIARGVGAVTGHIGISPRMIDNVAHTVAGGLVTHLWYSMDHILRAPALVSKGWPIPAKPRPRMSDIMLVRRLTADEFGSGTRGEFYEFKNKLDTAYAVVNRAASQMEKASRTRQYAKELIAREKIKPVYKYYNEIRKAKDEVKANRDYLSGGELRRRLDYLERLERPFLKRFKQIRSEYDRAR